MAKSAPPPSTHSPTVGKAQLTAKQALAQTRRAPQDPHGWKEHGRHLFNADDLEGAKVALERAAKLDPTDHGIWLLLGYTLLNAGEESPAIARFEHALSLQNDVFEAHLNLAYLYLRRNETGTSITHIEKALSMQPNSTLALRVKAQLLTVSSKHEEAIEIFERLIRQDKTNTHDYWNDLGNIKREVVQLEDALDCYRKAAAYSGTKSVALSNQITLLHYMPDRDPSDILELCKRWGQTFTPRKTVVRPKPSNSSPDKVLRIAMLSDGFRQHPVGAMITPAISHLKRFGVQLYMYTSSSAVDSVTKKLIASADQWTSIFNISDGDLAQRIRNDQIDILIDLSGHNAGTRMKAIALEPAPVIVKWVGGLINTTGVPAIDYLITDSVESPPGSDAFYTEKLIRMPDDYICYMPPDQIPEVRSLPAQRNGFVTFGCFNNPTKVNDVVLGHWAQLLHAVPGSHLYLKGGPFGTNYLRQRTLDTLASHGINADRVRIEGQSHHFELLDSYNEVDIALDPWPYSGGLTTCEAMLMGVPVITLPGPTFAGRHSATHLVNAGMPELVVSDWDEYQARAAGLASDLESLATIRSHLRRILLESPVCDGEKFGRHLGDALRAIWQRYCEDKPPAALVFTPEGLPWFETEEAPCVLAHPTPAALASPEAFQFELQGKIVTLDHGASFIHDERFANLSRLRALTTIVMDPGSVLNDAAELLRDGRLQHYEPGMALGDGDPVTLYACLDASFSGTLEPLPTSRQLASTVQGAIALTTISIPTVALDHINGLGQLDWLILDDRHDNLGIIQSSGMALTNALALQVRISFTPIYKDGCDFSSLCVALAKQGFSLLRLENLRHCSHFPVGTAIKESHAGSQLISADVVFIPDQARLECMSAESRQKLAFILHSVYKASDVAYRVLTHSDDDSAREYLAASGLAEPVKAPKPSSPSFLCGRNASVRTYVGVPIFNEEQHIEQTIRSLIAQTADGIHFHISDNCSTDRTLEIVRDLVAYDERFKVSQQVRNYGSAANLTSTFENTSSEFFMWMGGHDCLSPRYFEEVMERLQHDPSVSMVLGMPFAIQDAVVHPLPMAIYDFSDASPVQRYLDSVARLANCTILQSVFRRKDLLDAEIRGVSSFDHVLISHLLWKGKLAYVNGARYYRRYFHDRSQSYEARISGQAGELPRTDMYDYYIDDLSKLAQPSMSPNELNALKDTVLGLLRKRFG